MKLTRYKNNRERAPIRSVLSFFIRQDYAFETARTPATEILDHLLPSSATSGFATKSEGVLMGTTTPLIRPLALFPSSVIEFQDTSAREYRVQSQAGRFFPRSASSSETKGCQNRHSYSCPRPLALHLCGTVHARRQDGLAARMRQQRSARNCRYRFHPATCGESRKSYEPPSSSNTPDAETAITAGTNVNRRDEPVISNRCLCGNSVLRGRKCAAPLVPSTSLVMGDLR